MSADLQDIERALLTSQWASQTQPSSCKPLVVSLAQAVAKGEFREVLLVPEINRLFTVADHDRPALVDQPISTWFSFVLEPNSGSEYNAAETELLHLIAAIACLHAFIQVNWTGPDFEVEPSTLLQPNSTGSNAFDISEVSLNQKAVIELAYGGEPAYHLAKATAFLRFAQILFELPYKNLQSPSWWRLRATVIHECLLDEADQT